VPEVSTDNHVVGVDLGSAILPHGCREIEYGRGTLLAAAAKMATFECRQVACPGHGRARSPAQRRICRRWDKFRCIDGAVDGDFWLADSFTVTVT